MAAVPAIAVEPAQIPKTAVPARWADVEAFFPFVSSIGAFGVAHPVLRLPTCHKQICERSLGAERESARASTESKVLEVGVVGH